MGNALKKVSYGIGCLLMVMGLAACGDQETDSDTVSDTGSITDPDKGDTKLPQERFTLTVSPIKTLTLSWSKSAGATHYRLFENPDGLSGFSPIGGDLPADQLTYQLQVPLFERKHAKYLLQACDDTHCEAGLEIAVQADKLMAGVGYIKSDAPRAGAYMGADVDISVDGRTLLIGETDPSYRGGKVHLFEYQSEQWTRQLTISESSEDFLEMGESAALSGDGNRLVAAKCKISLCELVTYSKSNGSWTQTGKNIEIHGLYLGLGDDLVLDRTGSRMVGTCPTNIELSEWNVCSYRWSEQGWEFENGLKIQEEGYKSHSSLSLNQDGTLLAVATMDSEKNTSTDRWQMKSAAFLFRKTESGWEQIQYFPVPAELVDLVRVNQVSLSGNGSTLAMTLSFSDTGSEVARLATSVEVDGKWHDLHYLDLAAQTDLSVGNIVWADLNDNGQTLVVGLGRWGADTDHQTGSVLILKRESTDTNWHLASLLQAPNAEPKDYFGVPVAVSDQGDVLVTSATGEDSHSTDLNGDMTDNSIQNAGAVYLY